MSVTIFATASSVRLTGGFQPQSSAGDDNRDDGLYADADAVKAAVRRAGDEVILLGHSYGGTVITDAAAGDEAVAHLVYLTAMIPDTGDSLASMTSGPASWVRATEDGYVELITDQFDELFLQDCDQEAKAGAHRRVARQSALAFSQPVRGAAWRSLPSTYVVCNTASDCGPTGDSTALFHLTT